MLFIHLKTCLVVKQEWLGSQNCLKCRALPGMLKNAHEINEVVIVSNKLTFV